MEVFGNMTEIGSQLPIRRLKVCVQWNAAQQDGAGDSISIYNIYCRFAEKNHGSDMGQGRKTRNIEKMLSTPKRKTGQFPQFVVELNRNRVEQLEKLCNTEKVLQIYFELLKFC